MGKNKPTPLFKIIVMKFQNLSTKKRFHIKKKIKDTWLRIIMVSEFSVTIMEASKGIMPSNFLILDKCENRIMNFSNSSSQKFLRKLLEDLSVKIMM